MVNHGLVAQLVPGVFLWFLRFVVRGFCVRCFWDYGGGWGGGGVGGVVLGSLRCGSIEF